MDVRGLLIKHLLRSNLKSLAARDAQEMASVLEKPYPTVTANLRELMPRRDEESQQPARTGEAGHQPAPKVYRTYIVDPYETEFCHAYRVGMRLDGQRIAAEYSSSAREVAGQALAEGPIERFVDHLILETKRNTLFKDDLIILDAVALHGAPGRDVELHVVTTNGIYAIGRYVREVLVKDPCVREVTTVTVGWQYAFGGYAGRHANSARRRLSIDKCGGSTRT